MADLDETKRPVANEGTPPMAGVRRKHAVHINDGSTDPGSMTDDRPRPVLLGQALIDMNATLTPEAVDAVLHPAGKCVCLGEGRCDFCLRMHAQLEAEELGATLSAEAFEAMANVERSKQVEFDHWASRLTTEGGTPERRFEVDVLTEVDKVARMLVTKNKAYGDSALNPLRIFSKADAVEQILVRLDDKLSRIGRGHAAGEDPEFDAMGYLILLSIARKRRAALNPVMRCLADDCGQVLSGIERPYCLRHRPEPLVAQDPADHPIVLVSHDLLTPEARARWDAGEPSDEPSDEPTDEAMDEFDAAHHQAHTEATRETI